MSILERKFLGHYLDDSFAQSHSMTRLGEDLEEFNQELNPDIETSKNILGKQSIKHNGYEVSASVEPYYYATSDTLATKVWDIANKRLQGDETETESIDVLFTITVEGNTKTVNIISAYKETVSVIPQSMGGDTSGVQIPFELYYHGDRVEIPDSQIDIDPDTGELTYTPS